MPNSSANKPFVDKNAPKNVNKVGNENNGQVSEVTEPELWLYWAFAKKLSRLTFVTFW